MPSFVPIVSKLQLVSRKYFRQVCSPVLPDSTVVFPYLLPRSIFSRKSLLLNEERERHHSPTRSSHSSERRARRDPRAVFCRHLLRCASCSSRASFQLRRTDAVRCRQPRTRLTRPAAIAVGQRSGQRRSP